MLPRGVGCRGMCWLRLGAEHWLPAAYTGLQKAFRCVVAVNFKLGVVTKGSAFDRCWWSMHAAAVLNARAKQAEFWGICLKESVEKGRRAGHMGDRTREDRR